MAIGSPQWMYNSGSAYELEQSLRFNGADAADLSRTFTATGNRRTWTFSCWVKRGTLGRYQDRLFGCYQANDSPLSFYFNSSDNLAVANWATDMVKTTEVYRDTSAWYHCILALDTTQSTASNRAKIYVNGVQQATVVGGAGWPGLNLESFVNLTGQDHRIGSLRPYAGDQYYNGYLGEVNFIDGQALTPADFGETGTYGEWKPIEYSGTYGTNGFYLPFKQDYTVEGFSTVTYKGTGASQYIGGVGFQPDFVWFKGRSNNDEPRIMDSVRGLHKTFKPHQAVAEDNDETNGLTGYSADGVSIGNQATINTSGNTYVVWSWDMGGSNATNNDGSYTSTVRANTAYGQSIVSYDATKVDNATVGHGLDSAPEMIIAKGREEAYDWITYHKDLNGGTNPHTKYLKLNGTNAEGSGNYWGNAQPTSDVFTIGADEQINPTNSKGVIAYCFHSVSGYSKFGSYTGNGSATGPTITLGFEPAFLMVKSSSLAQSWTMVDNVREPTNPRGEKCLFANESTEEFDPSNINFNFTSTGFQLTNTDNKINGNGATYIYMAFADKREYAYWLDQSGNNNDWTSNNLTESDISVDSPTNNFPTWDALRAQRPSLFEGNLLTETSTNTISRSVDSNFRPVSGKWYVEVYIKVDGANSGQNATFVGVANDGFVAGNEFKGHNNGVGYEMSGQKGVNNSMSSYGASYATGDIIGIAYDVDNDNITFYKNGVSQGELTSGFDLSNGRVVVATNSSSATGQRYHANFGQDSSFAGLKTAQGNQDGNDIGDFYYTPPTGYLALCTKNLPDVAVTPSEHFNTVLWTGNGSTQSITGVGFEPNFSWIKSRSIADSHHLFDSVRGAGYRLRSDSTAAENYSGTHYLTAFNSDGFALGGDDGVNKNTATYASWNWKANGSGSSNTAGTITSTVSANVDSGFSIVTYTGTGATNKTVGHGLSSAPEMLIIKNRTDASYNWYVYHYESHEYAYNRGLYLNDTSALVASSAFFGATPTSSVFTIAGSGAQFTNISSKDYIAYCFHSVDGYSKVGSYTGNGNADGTFVYTGFRPAFVMVKNTTNTGEGFVMFNNKSDPTNVVGTYLTAYGSTAEQGTANTTFSRSIDFLSNGFKLRGNSTEVNENTPMIFIAFAETPFKYSNAR